MKADLAYVTEPSPGVFELNLDDGVKFFRVEVSANQLGNIVADGAAWLYRSRVRKLESAETQG